MNVQVTVGIDMAAEAKNTALCRIRWSDGLGRIECLSSQAGVSDADLLTLFGGRTEAIGIDVPLGWPAEFVEAVCRYHRSERWGLSADQRPRLRATDRFIKERLREDCATKALDPLSVSSDRIGVPAMRAAALISQAGLHAEPRDGSGPILEVYPAAALSQWRLRCGGYKGGMAEEKTVRQEIVSELLRRLGESVEVGIADEARLSGCDNALDAFVAALVVRCHQLGLTYPAPKESLERAKREGWIALPVPGSLGSLRAVREV